MRSQCPVCDAAICVYVESPREYEIERECEDGHALSTEQEMVLISAAIQSAAEDHADAIADR